MTREREFIYLAENPDGHYLMALQPLAPGAPALWTADPEQAIRSTWDGMRALVHQMSFLQARKVLVP